VISPDSPSSPPKAPDGAAPPAASPPARWPPTSTSSSSAGTNRCRWSTAVVLTVSLVAAMSFVIAVMLMPRPLWGLDVLVLYQAPVIAAFTAFALERIKNYQDTSRRQWIMDSIVVAVAATRALIQLPMISGHAMFLTYAALTTEPGVARWLAAILLVEVVFVKVAYLNDSTWIGGIIVGGLAALASRPVGQLRSE
jgi:hypothetical protein